MAVRVINSSCVNTVVSAMFYFQGYELFNCVILYVPFCHCSDSIIIPTTSFGTGPIFLDQLACTVNDSKILECPTFFSPIGLHGCIHAQDASVKCTGKEMILLFVCACV